MSATEEARVKVTLNNEEAKQELTELQNEIKRLIELKVKAEKEGDVKGYKKIDAALKKANREAKKYEKQLYDVDKALSDINGASLNDLKKAQAALTLQTSKLNRKTDEYTQKKAKLRLVKNEITKIRMEMGMMKTPMQKAIGWAKGLLPAFGFAAIVMGIRRVVSEADSRFLRFEERIDNLSALTGLEGKQLDWLTKKAKETSVATVEGNIRIKQSADSIVDAYTKVGSKRPELLAVKEDLANVTQEAIILSEAAKSSLEPAVAGLTMGLNQFDMAADQSRRIINVLAAGSKAGAGDIPYLTEAMEKSGTTAHLMKIPIEQWAASIESVAPFYEKASMAGNSFDKVLLKLKEKQIGYVDGVFDMNTALDELEKMYASGKSSASIFGVEHSKMGELLVKERENFNKYTKAVTGSNVAIEQAGKNTNNEAAKRAQAQNKLNLLYLEFGEKIAPLLTKGISSGVKLLSVAIKYRAILIPLTAAIIAYTTIAKAKVLWDVAQKGAAIMATGAQALFTGNVTRATAAMRLFNKVTKLNPYVLIASLIAAAGIALFAYSKRIKDVTAAQKQLLDVEVKAQQSIVEQKVKTEQLLRTAKNEKVSLDDRKKALQELNKISPEYFGNLTLEKTNTEEAKTATDNYIESLLTKARVQAAEESLMELEKERIKAEAENADYQIKWHQTLWNTVKSGGNAAAFAYNQAMSSAKNATKAEEDYLAKKEALIGKIEKEIELTGKGKKKKIITGTVDLTKEQQKVKDLILKAQNELNSAKIESLKDGIEKERAIENQRWKEEEEALKARLITKTKMSADELALNDSLNQQLELRKTQHLDRINDLVKADTERKKFEALEIDVLLATTDNDRWIAKMARLKTQFDQEFELAEGNRRKELEAEKKFNDAVKGIEKEKIDAKLNVFVAEKEIQIAKLQVAKDGLATLSQLVGEETALGKALFLLSQAAAVGQIIFNTGIANAKAVAASPLTFGQPWVTINTVSAGVSISAILAQSVAKLSGKKTKEHAQGKYPIQGESGNWYDATFAGKPKTGLYKGPQLGIFNENPSEPEMVIDGRTTKQLQLNRPDIVRVIHNFASGRFSEHASGKYPTQALPPSAAMPVGQGGLSIDRETINKFADAVDKFENLKIPVSYEMFKTLEDKYERMQKGSSM